MQPAIPTPPPLPPELAARIRKDFGRMVKTKTHQDLESGNFYQALSPEKQSQLVDLLAENEIQFIEHVDRLARQGKILTEDEFVLLRNEQEARIKNLLNEPEYRDYQQHASTAPDRNLVARTAERLGRSLSEEATQSLLAILAEERQQLARYNPASKEDSLQALADMAGRVKARAHGLLNSDEERAALQEVLDELGRGRNRNAVPK